MQASNLSRQRMNLSYFVLLSAGTVIGTAQAAVEVYELSTPTGGYLVVDTGVSGFAQSTASETYADPLTGVTSSTTNTTTALAANAFGSFGVALGTSTNVVVCKENGQWIPKRQAFAIGPYTETTAFQPFSRITTGSFALSEDGAVQVYNNIVDRMPTYVPDQLNARYMTRMLSFSLAALPTAGQSTPTTVTFGGPALAIDIPSFRAFSTQNVTGAEFGGNSTVTLSLKATGTAEQIPPSCLSSNAKALSPGAIGGTPVGSPGSGSQTDGGSTAGPGSGSQTGGGSTNGPGSGGSSGGGATTTPGSGGNNGDGTVTGPGSGGASGGGVAGPESSDPGTDSGDAVAAPSSGTSSGPTSGGSGGGSFDWLSLALLFSLGSRAFPRILRSRGD